MQKAEIVLTILRKQSSHSGEFVFDRLYRNLFNPDFYMLAYNNLHAKTGNMTPGVDGETIDGFNIGKVHAIIEKIRHEMYYPKPSRRTYIPKKNGKQRPLGIPSFGDKLVQEVLRMLLEAIYEPTFRDTSHGFRPGKSCHTALMQVKETCHGTTWAVEGDIKGFFDNINHEILLDLLARRIGDGRFIELVRRFLKAGYLEFHQVYNTLTGTPQGGIISPVLANIYLHELDMYIEGLCRKHSVGKTKKQNPPYHNLCDTRYRARKRGDYSTANELLKEMRKIPALNPMDSGYIRVHYVRYADDFLILVNGSKELANSLKKDVGEFLTENLKLEMSDEKTLVTHLATRNIRFLGYKIGKAHEDTAICKDSIGRKKRHINGAIQFLVPGDVINEKLKPFKKDNKPTARRERVDAPVLNTLMQYNAEMRGLYNYYRLAMDVSTKLNRFLYYHYRSLLKTIAQKERSSINKVLSKYGVTVPVKRNGGLRRIFGVRYETKSGWKTATYFNESIRKILSPCPGKGAEGVVAEQWLLRHQIIDRINARKCELCGFESGNQDDFEVHHVRKLKDIKQKHTRRGATMPLWLHRMAAMNRKTLITCKTCHLKIHLGKMDKSLKVTVENENA